jgi:tetratricopeptide (TPR) repeat protein
MKYTDSITNLNEGGSRVFFKRPLSLIFICIYSAAFVIAIIISAFTAIDFMDFLYGFSVILTIFCVPLFILFLILLFLNIKKHKRRTRGFGIGAAVCFVAGVLALISGSMIEDQSLRAYENYENKKYETAIEYYDYVIDKKYEDNIIETAMDFKSKALEEIAKAEMFRSNGDIFFKYGLYSRAESEYRKAYDTYPYLKGIKEDVKQALTLKEKYGENLGEMDYVLFKDTIKFSNVAGFPGNWGKVKISDPLLAEFSDIKLEEGSFFEAGNEMRISGTLTGNSGIANYLDSTEGLFVFISAYLVDVNGNIKWSKDGYLKGESPFIRSGETKQFSLISLISSPLEKGDSFYIAAYIKRSLLVILNPSNPESPDADKNIFALYHNDF